MKLSEQIRSTHNQDGAIVLDIRQGQIFRFNLVGSRIFELLKLGYSNPQIAEEISREFRMDRETVKADLWEFLAQLETHGLLRSQRPESPRTL